MMKFIANTGEAFRQTESSLSTMINTEELSDNMQTTPMEVVNHSKTSSIYNRFLVLIKMAQDY